MITRFPFEKLVDFIAENANVSKDEVMNRINEKLSQFSNMISKEGAAFLVASELNVDLNKLNESFLKLNELIDGTEANVKIKILRDNGVTEFVRNDGNPGKVRSFLVGDETGITRLVLWNDLVDMFDFEVGKSYEIKNVRVKKNRDYYELHLSSSTKVKVIEDTNVKSMEIQHKFIKQIDSDGYYKILGLVVQVFEPRFFYVCPECHRKVEQKDDGFYCSIHGKVDAIENYMCSIVIDDTTETIRVALFKEVLDSIVKELGLDALAIKNFDTIKNKLLGQWMWLEGKVAYNKQFERYDFVAKKAKVIKNPEEAIKILEDELSKLQNNSKGTQFGMSCLLFL